MAKALGWGSRDRRFKSSHPDQNKTNPEGIIMWQEQNNQLYKEFKFKDFRQAFSFMNQVAELAEQENHHPRWTNEWNSVQIWLQTHSAGEITDKDRKLSEGINEIFEELSAPKLGNEELSSLSEIKLFADGGSRGNPGPSAGGFVMLDMEDNVVYESGKYLGITTNNQAEYHSLKGGLEAALKAKARIVHVYMDSMLVVNQLKGIYKVKNRDLWPIYEAIKKIVSEFEAVEFNHVPRELNKLADGMVNKTLDEIKNNG